MLASLGKDLSVNPGAKGPLSLVAPQSTGEKGGQFMIGRSFKFEAIEYGFNFVSFGPPMEHEAYLSLETGEIHLHSEYGDTEPLPENINEPGKYISIPHKNDLDLGKRLVLRFVSEYMPDDLADVQNIFSRRGAYSRYKDLLNSRGLLEKWFEYEDHAGNEALRQWCQEQGLELDG